MSSTRNPKETGKELMRSNFNSMAMHNMNSMTGVSLNTCDFKFDSDQDQVLCKNGVIEETKKIKEEIEKRK